jgi:NADP-dependent alcohol dehydrogenase
LRPDGIFILLNFDFHNPTRILFGEGQIERLTRLVPAGARVLVLYGGGSIRANGTYDQVMAALDGHAVFEFGGIEPNPSYETLLKAIELVKRENIDYLLAVGGGSVIDGTKFVAAGAKLDTDPWTILEQHAKNVRAALPFGVVLTLPATGSEMNSGSVITKKATQEKFAFMSRLVFPQFAILDPTRTYTLPARQVGNGIVDAFVHIMEQYMTVPADAKVQDRFAEGLLQTLVEEGPRALAEPENYAVRANLMWTATLALNGLIGAGVPQDWATHMIGHELTALYGLDHAQTLAVVLPAMLRERREAKRAKLLQYAARVWDLRDGDEDARIEAAIARTEDFFRSVGVPTKLADYGLGKDVVPAVVNALEAHGMLKLGETSEVTLEVSRRVLERCA